jgi:putative ATP-dependent endonuclease of OLD family
MSTEFQDSGIKITEVRIRNFRSLKEVNVSIDWLTVLIGANNSGKTSFLDALFAAIGAGQRVISESDVFLAPSENKVPRYREVIIDLLIRPTDNEGNIISSFSDYWGELWGIGVSQDDNDDDYVGIRTQMKWDSTRSEYITERNFLVDWQEDPKKWDIARINETAGSASAAKIGPLALYLMDAKRDISDELRNRGSFWHKLVSDLGLEDARIEPIEKTLNRINEMIISNSGVLAHVQDNLDDLYKIIGGDKSSVSITPIPRHIRDLSKGMDINFATKEAQTFPLARHGMGTRSLAAVLMFRAYSTWRQENAKGEVHPMLALEEPEAHLHPQAHRALFKQIKEIPGQRIISTHSPYIASQAKIVQFRHFHKDGADTAVTQINTTSLTDEDIRKINRMVLNTMGEILYARALVLFEGETEEQALPIFAKQYWGRQPDAFGVTLAGVGGSGNYLPFLRLASSFGIPWYIFSDGETDALKHVKNALKQIGVTDTDPTKHPKVFVLPNGYNFESYLVSEKYEDTILTMLNSYHNIENYLDNEYIPRMHGQKKTKTADRDYKSSGGRQRALVDVLTDKKTQYAVPLASSIAYLNDETRRFPDKLRELFEIISTDLGLERGV